MKIICFPAALTYVLFAKLCKPALASIVQAQSKIYHGAEGTALPEQCRGWLSIRDTLQNNIFSGGQCGRMAQAAIRLTFHDSIGLSKQLESSGSFGGGGADGSIIRFHEVEMNFPASRGLENITYVLKNLADTRKVSYGDIIQFAGAVALSNCPGSPRLQFLTGRPEARYASPPSLVPSPADSTESILARMADAGFTADDTVVLLAAHSVGRQEIVDTSVEGMPLDSTPERFDSQFYLEVLLKGKEYPGKAENKSKQAQSSSPNMFRLASDASIARDPVTACKWQYFISKQLKLASEFRNAMMKLANNGQNVEDLTDCSEIVPIPTFWVGPAMLPKDKTFDDIEMPCVDEELPALRWENQRI